MRQDWTIRCCVPIAFIERERFTGTSYRAAKGRGKLDRLNRATKPIKDILTMPAPPPLPPPLRPVPRPHCSSDHRLSRAYAA